MTTVEGCTEPNRDAGEAITTEAPDQGWASVRAPFAIVAGAFVASRLIALAVGVRFDMLLAAEGWQFLELAWLREDLLLSLLNLHSQPPLMNLALGIATKVAPGREILVFAPAFSILGLLTALAMLDLLRRLRVSAGVAVVATLLFSLSPSALLYEHWFFYMHPVAAFLTLGAWAITRYAQLPTFRRALLAWSLAAVPPLLWSLFHVAWYVAVVGAVVVLHRAGARRTLAAAAIPLVVILGWYGKNLLVFESFGASTWMGQSVYRAAATFIPDAEIEALVEEGTVHPIALIPDFLPLEAYKDIVTLPEPTGVPALDERLKGDGQPNFNHLAYIEMSEHYQEAGLAVLRERPRGYLETLARGVCGYLTPAGNYWFLRDNRALIHGYERVYNGVVLGQAVVPPTAPGCYLASTPHFYPLLLPPLLAASILTALVLAVRGREPETRLAMAFAAATLGWVLAVGNGLESTESNRFRFVTEPLMWVALAMLAERLIQRFRARSGAGRSASDRSLLHSRRGRAS